MNPNTTFQDTGIANVGGVSIRNWDFGSHGTETMTQVLINSCNIGAQYVAGLLGPDRFYRYIEAFGFGKETGIDLPGESPGMVRTNAEPNWSRVDLATNSYGQGIAVTGVQMLNAVSAIANNGVLMKPQIVRGYRQGESVREIAPVQQRRVISPETAKLLTDMMVHVVEDNSLKLSVVPGYKIAGKTGTADLPTAAGYTSGVTYASQVGFRARLGPQVLSAGQDRRRGEDLRRPGGGPGVQEGHGAAVRLHEDPAHGARGVRTRPREGGASRGAGSLP